MTRAQRMRLISEIEKITGSRLITIFLGDRRGLETKIAADILPFCSEHLAKIDGAKKISLYLYSTGGITIAGYAIANLLREYCDSYDVIVPFKALSCATLISLGADSIVMTKMGQLSPIDPSITSPLAPAVQGVAPGGMPVRQVVPVNVEDVINYIDLARKVIGIKDEELLTRLYDRMSQSVHPLVLGSVYRSREQIGFLAQMLLERHMTDKEKIKEIIEIVTRGRFSHDYVISRREAKDIGLPLADVPRKFESKIVQLYRHYDEILQLSVPYHPEQVLKGNSKATGDLNRAIIETRGYTNVFRTKKEVTKTELKPPMVPEPQAAYVEAVLSESWETDNTL